jgi:hypothetical protein
LIFLAFLAFLAILGLSHECNPYKVVAFAGNLPLDSPQDRPADMCLFL